MLNPLGFSWVGLFVSDLPKAIDFYENKLGLHVLERHDGCCIFDAGAGALFEIWGKGFASAMRKTAREQSMLVGFLVENLELAVETVKSRGVQPDSAMDSYLGTRWIYYTDLEGNRFELKDLRG